MTTHSTVVVVVISDIPPATHVEFEIKVEIKNVKKNRIENILKIFSNYMAYHRISMSQSNQTMAPLSFALNVTLLKRNENKNPNLVENFSCVLYSNC